MDITDFRKTFLRAIEGFDCAAVKDYLDWSEGEFTATLIGIGLEAWSSYQQHGGVGRAVDNGIECTTDGDYVQLSYTMSVSKAFQELPF